MNEPFLRRPGAKTRKCFLSFQENNFAENGKMFSNPSLEMRFRLVKAEIHWAVKYRLSDGQNYPRGIIQWKNYIPGIIEEELSENYGGSSCWTELFPPPAAASKWQQP